MTIVVKNNITNVQVSDSSAARADRLLAEAAAATATGVTPSTTGIIRATNIAALRTNTPVANQIAVVSGYYNNGDGGGGEFYGVTGGSYTDDGGTTIVPGGGTGTTAWKRIVDGRVSVKWFGTKSDGVNDDRNAIQTAIEYGMNNNINVFFPAATYLVGSTIFIPNRVTTAYYDNFIIDGGGCTIKSSGNITVFTSAYYNSSGVLVTNVGTSELAHPSFGIIFKDLTITSAVQRSAIAIDLQDWHQGCKLLNIKGSYYGSFLRGRYMFYCKVDNVQTAGSGGTRFEFNLSNNLIHFNNCVAAGADIGYKFTGGVTALTLTGMSVEGVVTGIQFTDQVYDVEISGSYFESWTGTAIEFNSYVNAAKISNNYFNFTTNTTCYLLDYAPGPGNNVWFDSSNTVVANTASTLPNSSQYIKTLSAIAGYNKLTWERPAASAPVFPATTTIDSLIVDNTVYSPEIDFRQTIYMDGMRANLVNKYAKGNYAGCYTAGFLNRYGFTWTNNSNSSLQLNTRFTDSATGRIYVSLRVSVTGVGSVFVTGEFVRKDSGWVFYEYDASGMNVTTTITATVVSGYIRVGGTFANAIFDVVGEMRLS